MALNTLIDHIIDKFVVTELDVKDKVLTQLIAEYLGKYQTSSREELVKFELSKILGSEVVIAVWKREDGSYYRKNFACNVLLRSIIDTLNDEHQRLRNSYLVLSQIINYCKRTSKRDMRKIIDLEDQLILMLDGMYLYGDTLTRIGEYVNNLRDTIISEDHLPDDYFAREDFDMPILRLEDLHEKALHHNLNMEDMAYLQVASEQLDKKMQSHKIGSMDTAFGLLSLPKKYEIAYYSYCLSMCRQIDYSIYNYGAIANPTISDNESMRADIIDQIINGEATGNYKFNAIRFTPANYPLKTLSKQDMLKEISRLKHLKEAYDVLVANESYFAREERERLTMTIDLYEGIVANRDMSSWQDHYHDIIAFIDSCLSDLENIEYIPKRNDALDYMKYSLTLLKYSWSNTANRQRYPFIDIHLTYLEIIDYIMQIGELMKINNIYAYTKIIELYSTLCRHYERLCELLSIHNMENINQKSVALIEKFITKIDDRLPKTYSDDIKKNIYRLT